MTEGTGGRQAWRKGRLGRWPANKGGLGWRRMAWAWWGCAHFEPGQASGSFPFVQEPFVPVVVQGMRRLARWFFVDV